MIRVAEVNEIPPGTGRQVEVSGRAPLAVFNVEGAFFAIDDRCPHADGPLGKGELLGSLVHCPWHGWPFDVTTGQCSTIPSARVARYPVEVRDGAVWVTPTPL